MSTHDPTSRATGARPVMLARSRPGVTGHSTRPVHLIPLPVRAESAALCGVRLDAQQVETVTPGEGVACTLCVTAHLSGIAPPPPDSTTTATEPVLAASRYRALGWPVTLRRNQVLLSLDSQAVAFIIPATLATRVTALLATDRCRAPVLAHPHAPQHRIIVAGEPFGVPLPWPEEIRMATGPLLLPPTRLASGPVTWMQLPDDHTLGSCREIDVFSAVRRLS